MKIKDNNPPLASSLSNEVLEKLCSFAFEYYDRDLDQLEDAFELTKNQASHIAVKAMLYDIKTLKDVIE
jgi:hypothetical protein